MASSFAARRNQATRYWLLATGCNQEMTRANEPFARVVPMTCSQSPSPVASVNASIARANDALPLAAHLPCFLEDEGVTKVTPPPNVFRINQGPAHPGGANLQPSAEIL
jgi:hypothetical protein